MLTMEKKLSAPTQIRPSLKLLHPKKKKSRSRKRFGHLSALLKLLRRDSVRVHSNERFESTFAFQEILEAGPEIDQVFQEGHKEDAKRGQALALFALQDM
jgi:hypothetical protein